MSREWPDKKARPPKRRESARGDDAKWDIGCTAFMAFLAFPAGLVVGLALYLFGGN